MTAAPQTENELHALVAEAQLAADKANAALKYAQKKLAAHAQAKIDDDLKRELKPLRENERARKRAQAERIRAATGGLTGWLASGELSVELECRKVVDHCAPGEFADMLARLHESVQADQLNIEQPNDVNWHEYRCGMYTHTETGWLVQFLPLWADAGEEGEPYAVIAVMHAAYRPGLQYPRPY